MSYFFQKERISDLHGKFQVNSSRGIEMNFWPVKIEGLAWSFSLTLSIFNAITDTRMMLV